MLKALRQHWPEYLMEAAGLAAFMVSASLFASLIEHPASPVREAAGGVVVRRALMGAAMGATAVAIIYSPWGKRSGAHINPGVTLAFWWLGKVAGPDAFYYAAAQFVGGAAGALAAAVSLAGPLAHPSVNYVVTVPGRAGTWAAFAAEVLISFGLFSAVLLFTNARRLNRYTGLLAGVLVATYITLEAPLSGMSMNPARTFASAATSGVWTAWWVYFTAPPLGMLLAAELYAYVRRAHPVLCAKLHHENAKRCIFHCKYGPTAR